ncbi:MAG TPA: uracil-DNA glycosylase [Eoetvoesiella sp.]
MIEPGKPESPQLNATQLAWLQEIGIDKRLLARFRQPGKVAAVTNPSATARLRAQVATPPPVAGQKVESLQPAIAPQSNVLASPLTPAAQRSEVGQATAPGLTSTAKLLKGARPDVPVPQDWNELEAHVASCQACSLFGGRSQTVFGAGATDQVDWLIIGEAPGEHDDRLGVPFQGKAGELLRAMLGCVGLGPESSVFYTNLIKCRPRGNRAPRPEEIAACMPYLQRQIALLKPQRILVLGRLAAQALLGDESNFEQLRGRTHIFHSETGADIPVVATYHPASLLSRPQHKANAWRDLNLALIPFPNQP